MSDRINQTTLQPNETREHATKVLLLANRVIDAVEGRRPNILGYTEDDAAVARAAIVEVLNG